MRTIDEAIRHCEEVAEEKESICNVIENKGETWTDSGKNYYDICKKCASEHRQLAEWLKELKTYRNIRQILSQNRIATDRYGEVVMWDDIKRVIGEVNADEGNSN